MIRKMTSANVLSKFSQADLSRVVSKCGCILEWPSIPIYKRDFTTKRLAIELRLQSFGRSKNH